MSEEQPVRRTDDLIDGLCADLAPARPLTRRIALAFAIGVVAATVLWLSGFRLRGDLAQAIATPHLVAKLGLALALSGGAFACCLVAARPLGRLRSAGAALALVPVALAALVAAELARMPISAWREVWLTGQPLECVASIMLIAAPVMLAMMIALRAGAPRSPARLGAFAGLCAAGLAGALFGLSCSIDSPIYVATWYGLAALLLAGIGALAGRRWLAW